MNLHIVYHYDGVATEGLVLLPCATREVAEDVCKKILLEHLDNDPLWEGVSNDTIEAMANMMSLSPEVRASLESMPSWNAGEERAQVRQHLERGDLDEALQLTHEALNDPGRGEEWVLMIVPPKALLEEAVLPLDWWKS